jgi:hypothetical protein
MAIYPVGVRKEMKTQLFREAQVASPEHSSFYMQTGSSAPVLDQQEKSSDNSVQDVKDFVVSILIGDSVGIPQRIVDKKLENLVSYSVNSAGEMNGFFVIPTHTGSRKIALNDAREIVSKFEKQFNCDCEIEHGKNFKIKFKSIPKPSEESPSDDEGSLKFVPDEKGSTKKVAESFHTEQSENRVSAMFEHLRKIGFIK